MKEENKEGIKRIDEPELNRQIVWLFLDKLEKMTLEERKEILHTIALLNSPVFLST